MAPFELKTTGDRAFVEDVNRVVLHASAHQPWPHLKPGMTMGWWGTQFGPGQTWWEHGGPEWIAYLSRCQFLLQQGTFAADLCYFGRGHDRPEIPAGYNGDVIGERALLERMELRNGRVTFTTYKFFTAASPLLPSGLLGPVKIETLVPDNSSLADTRQTAKLPALRASNPSSQ